MPNHILNRIAIEKQEKYLEVVEFMKSKEHSFDFNNLVPMPEKIILSMGKNDDWYQWSVENWGTKWNAYDIEKWENIIEFQTAWSHPYPVIVAMSKRFPDVTFNIEYADEDIHGDNFGAYQITNGNDVKVETEPDFATKLWGITD